MLKAFTEDVLMRRLRLLEEEGMPRVHSRVEEIAVSNAVEFALKNVATVLEKHRAKEIVGGIFVPTCEESSWLWELLGEQKWEQLGKITDAIISK